MSSTPIKDLLNFASQFELATNTKPAARVAHVVTEAIEVFAEAKQDLAAQSMQEAFDILKSISK